MVADEARERDDVPSVAMVMVAGGHDRWEKDSEKWVCVNGWQRDSHAQSRVREFEFDCRST